jgi:glutathione reductase (NADPH)
METEKLPERIIFIGGGYISMEFSHIARRAGSEVTILHRSESLLRHFDTDMVNLLIKASEAAGIKILTNKPAVAVEKKGDSFLVRTEFESETRNFDTDMVVHGASRVPDIEDLNLEKAGVKIEKGAIKVE